MAHREKLIELLSKKIYPRVEADPAEVVADYLIDNGVTAQEHGRWIWDEDGMDFGLGCWKCSHCKTKPESYWEASKCITPLVFSGSSFCPNCGARMDGDGDG